jgi:hypothetical protein
MQRVGLEGYIILLPPPKKKQKTFYDFITDHI